MRFSETFIKTKRFSDHKDSANAELLERGGFIDQHGAGIYSYLPLGLRVIEKITVIVREEMNKIGANEVLLPALHHQEYWAKTGREKTEVSFKTVSQTGQKYILGWTHEEIITPLIKDKISSYRDLPLSLYQFQTKFRDELRPKSGLLRTKEFIMKDLYSFHQDKEDLDKFYLQAKKAYERIYQRLGIADKTYFTFASGGDFSPFSHEFQTISEVGEDKIHICQNCRTAINEEIFSKVKKCPECQKEVFKTEKAIEVGNIFNLGEKYTKAFGVTYQNKAGEVKTPVMGSYGIGISRLLGTIVEVSHDSAGIIWPRAVAPYKAELIVLKGAEKEGEKIAQELEKAGAEILYDDRDVSAGEKLNNCDLIGLPYRLLLSEKTIEKNKIELKPRNKKEANLVSLEEAIKIIKEQ